MCEIQTRTAGAGSWNRYYDIETKLVNNNREFELNNEKLNMYPIPLAQLGETVNAGIWKQGGLARIHVSNKILTQRRCQFFNPRLTELMYSVNNFSIERD